MRRQPTDSGQQQSRIKSLAVVLCVLLSPIACLHLHAQDIHFSQFNFSPLNQNPANTNLFDGTYRFIGNYKNQWPTVPVRFNTFSAGVDANLATLNNGDRVGAGLVFYYDGAGDSRFSALNIGLSAAYAKTLDKKKKHYLSYGIQFGMTSRSFSYDKLYFDNQWNGDAFNPNTGIDESFTRTRYSFFDLGMGLAYKWQKTERTALTVGFAVTHINTPSQSFYNDNSIKLNPRFTVHAQAKVKVAKRVDIVPEAMWQMQDVKQEFLVGAHAKYYIPAKIKHTVALNIGAYSRVIDAGWLMAGFDYDNLQFNMSYDINFSKLTAASRYNGGIEMSVIYILSKVKKIDKPGAVCPSLL